jgi:outer membrane cobalamin receptor
MGGGAVVAWQGAVTEGEALTGSALVRLELQHSRVDGRDLLTAEALPASSRTTLSTAASLPLRWGAWQLTPSGGADWASQQLLDARQYPFAWSTVGAQTSLPWFAALALAWRVHPTTALQASVRRGVRLANLQELFGDTTVIVANARLASERAVSAEAGGNWTLSEGSTTAMVDVRVHQTWAEDLIQLVGLGARQAVYQNIAAATLAGAEATLTLQHGGWSAHLQHGSLWTRDTSGRAIYDGKVLPMRPRTRWTGRVESPAWQLHTLTVTPWITALWQSGSFVDTANLIALPARVGASAGLRVEVPGSGAFAEVRVDNVTDAPWFDLVGYPLPGRAVWLQTGWRPRTEAQR